MESQLYCSQVNIGVVGAGNSDFILKASNQRRWWASVPNNCLTQVRIQASFYTERGGGMIGCCKLLGIKILCSCSCPCRSGHQRSCKPPTRQTLLFVLKLCISIWMENCCTCKGQNPENELSCILDYRQHCKCVAKARDYKVKVKERDLIWSQVCSSLLQWFCSVAGSSWNAGASLHACSGLLLFPFPSWVAGNR